MAGTASIVMRAVTGLLVANVVLLADGLAVGADVEADEIVVTGRGTFELKPNVSEPDSLLGIPSNLSSAADPAIAAEFPELGSKSRIDSGLLRRHAASNEGAIVSADSSSEPDTEYVVIDTTSMTTGAELLPELESIGLMDGRAFGRVASGRLPVSEIPQLGGISLLRAAIENVSLKDTGSVLSQGDAAQRSDVARVVHGVDGAGLTVGILSDSYDCLNGEAAGIASGDLPSGVVVLEELAGCTGAIDEGRAMAEIVHDVAPGADILFHTAFGGAAVYAQGIIDLRNFGADVIVDDVVLFTEPYFQDGIVAQAVNTVVDAGVPYFSSVGNRADQSYESAFRDTGVTLFLGTAHDFDPGPGIAPIQTGVVDPGESVNLRFQWSDPHASAGGLGAQTDLDIYLVENATSQILSSGATDNIASGNASESVSYTNTGVEPVEVFVVIERFAGPAPSLIKYVDTVGQVQFDFDTNSGSTFGHKITGGAFSLGAASYFETPEFGQSPPLLEFFSSSGGTQILYDVDGNLLPTPVVPQKPDAVAPNNANTTFFGNDIPEDADADPNFRGTSAAAPHAAAAAALILEAHPNLSPQQVYAALETTAIDMGTPGFDFDSGFGLIDVDAAISAAGSITAVPWRPSGVNVTPETNQASVQWDPSPFDGGSAITQYTVRATPGGATAVVSGDSRFATVTGLTGGVNYTFSVAATNAVGQGEFSEPSLDWQVWPKASPLDDPDGIPGLTANFDGMDDTLDVINVPDPQIAVGPNHVMTVTNRSYQVHLKEGGSLQATVGFEDFFSTFTTIHSHGDPTVIYDQYNSRFVVAVEDGDASIADQSQILVAVSDDNNPIGSWFGISIDGVRDIGGINHYVDQPSLGLDEDHIYITTEMLQFGSGTYTETHLWVLEKVDFYADGSFPSGFIFDPWDEASVPGAHGRLVPTHSFGTLPGNTGTWMAAYTATTITIIRVDNPLTVPVFVHQQFSQAAFDDAAQVAVPDAPQNGNSALIVVPGRAAHDLVWRNDSLWLAIHVVPPVGNINFGQATARWIQIDTSDLANLSIADQGNAGGVDVDANAYTMFPSIMVDKNDNMAIGFALSSPNHFGGAYYSGRLATDPAGTTRNTGVLRAGLDDFDLTDRGFPTNLWGPSSGIALDPTNESEFWLYNEYVRVEDRWGTHIGRFAFAEAPSAPLNAAATVDHLNSTATVTWDPPADDGGVPISEYLISSLPPTLNYSVSSSTRSVLATGLAKGVEYRFWVTAISNSGTGPPSAPSNAVTAFTPPGAPTGAVATPLVESAEVNWTAPADEGDAPIDSYTVTSTPSGNTAIVDSSTTTAVVTGLTTGVSYTFEVTATSAIGTGASSTPSNAVTPLPGIGFSSSTLVLENVSDSATTSILVQGVLPTTDRMFANLQHSAGIAISGVSCVGIFSGATLSTVPFTGGTTIECDLGVSNVTGTSGEAIEFTVTRQSAGTVGIVFDLQGATSTVFSVDGSPTVPIVTTSISVVEGFSISGVISLEGVSSTTTLAFIGPVVELTSSGGGSATPLLVGNDGTFLFTGIAPGVYVITASAVGFINRTDSSVTLDSDRVMAGVELAAGEVNGDGLVDVQDIGAIAALFLLVTADRTDGSGLIVDLNGDGLVDGLDISAAANNFLVTSPQTWP